MHVQNCYFFDSAGFCIQLKDYILEYFISVFCKIIDHVYVSGRTISRYHVQPCIHFILHIHGPEVGAQGLHFVPLCFASMTPLLLEVPSPHHIVDSPDFACQHCPSMLADLGLIHE